MFLNLVLKKYGKCLLNMCGNPAAKNLHCWLKLV